MLKERKNQILTGIVAVGMLMFLIAGTIYNNYRQQVINEPYNGSDVENIYYSEFSTNVLKEKYGYNSGMLSPIYNVAQTGEFDITFNCSEDLPDDAISIHTNIECNKDSEIETYKWVVKENKYIKNVSIKPYNMVLSDKTEVGWGNAPVYYVRINYNPFSQKDKLERLDTPIIIPFKLKSDVMIPVLSYSISENGIFNLIWNEVPGADSYNIYRLNIGTDDKHPSSYYGYSEETPKLIATVDGETLSWCDWNNDGSNGLGKVNDEVTLYQNYGLSGEYYITAVKEDKESLYSNYISVNDYADILPYKTIESDILKPGTYISNVKELPRSIKVETLGSNKINYSINYKIDETTRYTDNVYYNYNIKGTNLNGYIEVKVEDVASLPETINNGVKTFCDDLKISFYTTKSSSEPGNQINLNEWILTNRDIIVEANQKDIVAGGLEAIMYNVYADDSIEDYIASNLIRYKGLINLGAFPEVQDYTVLMDYTQKVLYQNPLILGIKSVTYNEDSKDLVVEYTDEISELKKLQREVYDSIQMIVPQVIEGDSNEDLAINLYNVMNSNYTYNKDNGLVEMIKNYSGNAIAYSQIFKLVSDEIGLKSIVVSGSLNGKLHTWNAVEYDGRWYYIDCTNNYKNTGLEYICYNMSSTFAKSIGYLANDKFCLNDRISLYESTQNDKEYYNQNKLVAKYPEDYYTIVESALKGDEKIIVARYEGEEIPSNTVVEEITKIYEENNKKRLLANLKFGDGLGYYVLWYQQKEEQPRE